MKRPVSKASERASKPSSSFTSTDRTTHTTLFSHYSDKRTNSLFLFFLACFSTNTVPLRTSMLSVGNIQSFPPLWLYEMYCTVYASSSTTRTVCMYVHIVLYARIPYLWSELFHRNLRFSPFQLCISRSPCDIVLKILWVSSISLLACLMY